MRALVLSGGGSKGAYQVGVLKKWMGEEERDYDIVCGVSVGALNSAGLAMVPKGQPKDAVAWLESFWRDHVTGNNAIYRGWRPFGALESLWKPSIYDSSPLIQLITKTIDPKKVAACGRQVRVGAVCLDTGEYRYGTQDDPNFASWVLASSAYPVFFTPINIEGKLWSDGGIKRVTPLGMAIQLGADEIDVIMCDNPYNEAPWSSHNASAVPDVMFRALDLQGDQIMKNDIEVVGLKNNLSQLDPQYKKVKVEVVMPAQKLNDNSLAFIPAEIDRMMSQGYADADHAVVYS